jgi:RNA polymerase sigma factor (TIGR02999 family)
MSNPSPREVTRLLQAWSNGDESALEKLIPLIGAEMHRLAQHYMRKESSGSVLQTTGLLHEVYVRLIRTEVEGEKVEWQSRAHFFGVSARIMRQVLVDYARRKHSYKRGWGVLRVSMDEAIGLARQRGEDVIDLDEALKELTEINPLGSQIVELRFFGGLTIKEIADVLGKSPRSIDREWSLARAWLYRRLSKSQDESRVERRT